MSALCQELMAAAIAAKGTDNAAEMRRYMDKLKDLVPQCPKNRKVTRLELIQHVIDYISDLQDTLQSDSDSDSPPESPVEHMSFTDAYGSSSPQRFSDFSAHASTFDPAGYSGGYSNNIAEVGCLSPPSGYDTACNMPFTGYSDYAHGSSTSSRTSGNHNSAFNTYSPILYSAPSSSGTMARFPPSS